MRPESRVGYRLTNDGSVSIKRFPRQDVDALVVVVVKDGTPLIPNIKLEAAAI